MMRLIEDTIGGVHPQCQQANLLLAGAMAAAIGSALAGSLAPALVEATWPMRLTVVFGPALLLAVIINRLMRRWRNDESLARRYLEELSRCDAATLDEETLHATYPNLPERSRWHGIHAGLKELILGQARRLAEAENARARAEVRSQRLTMERKQLAEILGNLQDPVVAIDQYDELVLANASAEQLLGLSARNADKRALESLIHCENLVELLRDTRRRKAPASRTSEVLLVDETGREHSFRVTCRSLTTDGSDSGRHAPHGAFAVLSDIGQLKAIQKRNAEFVSAVSHEMKAPLSGIKAYVELLADGEAEDEAMQEEFLHVISSQADRLQRLVENLLNLARMEAGVVEVHKQPRSLNELMEESLNVVQPAAEAKRIELVTDLSPMYLEVLADRDMVLQAAINLLSNAIKYTPGGGRVTLRTRMEDSQVVFEVEDTGVGLSQNDAGRVFEKFYRVKKDSHMAQGTGLGLPLARHIVEDVHGGTLTLESELGKGSTFRVVLPTAGCLVTAKV